MPLQESLTRSQAENLITLLCHSDEHGRLVALIAQPQLFEGDYRTIAERAIDYWHQHNEAPKVHTADLLSDYLDDPHNRKAGTFRRIIGSMVQLAEGINAEYVLRQLKIFTRQQQLKDAILRSAEVLNRPGPTTIEQVESILDDIMRARDTHFDPGVRLHDIGPMLEHLEHQTAEFDTGIKELDDGHIVPARKTLYMFLAPAGLGKTWFLVNLGKRALMRRKRILHLSYEVNALDLQQRYFQALFSVPKRDEDVEVTTMRMKGTSLSGFKRELIEPEFHFRSEFLTDELESRIRLFGEQFYDKAIIKQFPPRSMTPNDVRAYLDSLEATEGFIPDLLLVDAPYLLKTDIRNMRLSLGRNIEELRAIAVERNMAIAGVHQVSKTGAEAATVKATHVGEDWSIIWTADDIITYSSTDPEHAFGLARLFVSKARTERDKFGVLITQNYTIGQFVISSAPLTPRYFDIREQYVRSDDDAGEGEYDEEDGEGDERE